MAELIETGRSSVPIEALSIARFHNAPQSAAASP